MRSMNAGRVTRSARVLPLPQLMQATAWLTSFDGPPRVPRGVVTANDKRGADPAHPSIRLAGSTGSTA